MHVSLWTKFEIFLISFPSIKFYENLSELCSIKGMQFLCAILGLFSELGNSWIFQNNENHVNQKFSMSFCKQIRKQVECNLASWAAVKCQVRRRVLIMRICNAREKDNVTWRQPRAVRVFNNNRWDNLRETDTQRLLEALLGNAAAHLRTGGGGVSAQVKNTAGCCAPLRTETQSGSRRITCGSQVNKASEYRVLLDFSIEPLLLALCIYLLDFNLRRFQWRWLDGRDYWKVTRPIILQRRRSISIERQGCEMQLIGWLCGDFDCHFNCKSGAIEITSLFKWAWCECVRRLWAHVYCDPRWEDASSLFLIFLVCMCCGSIEGQVD